MTRIRIVLFALLWLAPATLWAQAEGFEGTWETSYGRMELSVDDNVVRGTYAYGGGSTVEGTVEGNRFTFRYVEPAARGDGWFELSDDGNSLQGAWREDGDSAWGDWSGIRVDGLAVDRGENAATGDGPFTGVYESSFGRVRLVQTGQQVSGTYAYGGGSTIEGSVEDGRFSFTYQEPTASGEGWFELRPDDSGFNGQWRATGGSEWATWTGDRVEEDPERVWLVVIEAQWELDLAEEEYSFGEMLEAYFARYPNVSVRHRRVHDATDFARAAQEIAFLAEPTFVLLASHGSTGALTIGPDRIGAAPVASLLRSSPHVFGVHFSSCEVAMGNTLADIRAALPDGWTVALSGYATSVDWSASALLEFLYLDLVLGRGLSPTYAAQLVESELNFADDGATAGSPLGAAMFRFEGE